MTAAAVEVFVNQRLLNKYIHFIQFTWLVQQSNIDRSSAGCHVYEILVVRLSSESMLSEQLSLTCQPMSTSQSSSLPSTMVLTCCSALSKMTSFILVIIIIIIITHLFYYYYSIIINIIIQIWILEKDLYNLCWQCFSQHEDTQLEWCHLICYKYGWMFTGCYTIKTFS